MQIKLQWKTTLREMAWITLIAVILACGAYILRPNAMPGSRSDDGPGADNPMVKAISLESAIDHFKAGTALFADARSLSAFEAGHIKGAMHLDPSEFDQWSEDLFSKAPSDTIIIVYCEGIQCQLSHDLAEKLTWLGYEKVFYLVDGWGQWKKKALPRG